MILSIFPFYYVTKLLLLVGCMWPDRKRNLSTILYNRFIRVYLMRNEAVRLASFGRHVSWTRPVPLQMSDLIARLLLLPVENRLWSAQRARRRL